MAPPDLPKGYVALSERASTYGIHWSDLAQTRELHLASTDSKELKRTSGFLAKMGIFLGLADPLRITEYALDNPPEIILDGPQLRRLEAYASQLGKQHPKVPNETLEQTRAREKLIVDDLVQKVYETYGSWNSDPKSQYLSTEQSNAIYEGRPAQLDRISGGFSCATYAATMALLAGRAGIDCHMVVSHTLVVQKKDDDFYGWARKAHLEGHAFVITTDGNAIIEGGVAGLVVDGKRVEGYRPIVNRNPNNENITFEGIVKRGEVAMVDAIFDGKFSLMGGHAGTDGSFSEEGVDKAMTECLKIENDRVEQIHVNEARRRQLVEIIRGHDRKVDQVLSFFDENRDNAISRDEYVRSMARARHHPSGGVSMSSKQESSDGLQRATMLRQTFNQVMTEFPLILTDDLKEAIVTARANPIQKDEVTLLGLLSPDATSNGNVIAGTVSREPRK